MALPTETTKQKEAFTDYSILVYGPSKIGKSTFCSHAEGALFLATEPGLNSLEVFQMPIANWQDMLNACGDLAKGDHQFKTIVIDTVDNLYKMCSEHICGKHQMLHASDLGYGKGFTLINNEFHRVLTKLAFMPHGLIMISHSKEKEIDTRTGKRNKTCPTLPGSASEIVTGLVDIILFCDIETTQEEGGRPIHQCVMRTKSHPDYEAGDRTKKLPPTIPLDFKVFAKYFTPKKGA